MEFIGILIVLAVIVDAIYMTAPEDSAAKKVAVAIVGAAAGAWQYISNLIGG